MEFLFEGVRWGDECNYGAETSFRDVYDWGGFEVVDTPSRLMVASE